MNRTTIVAAAILAATAVTASTNSLAAPTSRRSTTQTIQYGADPAQYIIETTPTGVVASNRPWVITLHGGSWIHSAAGDSHMVIARDAFTSVGITVLDVNYRLMQGDVGFAEQKDDIGAALDYARAHATELGIDPNRGLVYGYSAGGHLAAELALRGDGEYGVKGLITIAAVYQPHRIVLPGVAPTVYNLNVYGYEVMGIGCPYGVCPTEWAPFAPQNELSPSDPDVLAFQGDDDDVIPPTAVDSMAYWAGQHSVGMTAVHVAGYGHTDRDVYDVAANKTRMLSFATARLGCRSTGC